MRLLILFTIILSLQLHASAEEPRPTIVVNTFQAEANWYEDCMSEFDEQKNEGELQDATEYIRSCVFDRSEFETGK